MEGGDGVIGRGSGSKKQTISHEAFDSDAFLTSPLWPRSEVTFHCDLQGLSVRVTAEGEGALPRASVLVAHRVQTDFG